MKTSPILTDSKIIAKHAPGARARARLELAIVNKLIECAEVAGYRLTISDESEDCDVKTTLFDLDDAFVFVRDASGKALGWVRLVFGNDGYDLVSDYSISLDAFLAPVTALANSLVD